jgi:AcrR family transcriptional regulator
MLESDMSQETSRETGLRERKKQRTRETISRVALRLFVERGYHATTLAEIAEAADVSTRTIFAYYPSKEDILFSDFPALLDAVARMLRERPAGKDALETIRDFILTVPHDEKDELHQQRHAIIESDATLRSHMRARMVQLQDLVAAAVAEDIGADADDLRPHVVAASLIAAFEVLSERDPGETAKPQTPEQIAAVIDPVIAFLRGGLEALAHQPGA